MKEFCAWSLRINLSHASYSHCLIPIMGAPLSLFDNDFTKLKSYASIQLTFGSLNLQISIHHFALGPMAL